MYLGGKKGKKRKKTQNACKLSGLSYERERYKAEQFPKQKCNTWRERGKKMLKIRLHRSIMLHFIILI